MERQLYKKRQEKYKKETSKMEMIVQPKSVFIDTNPKHIIAGEARNSLKLGNAYVQEKQETP
jgi:hypothetical protein